MSSNPDSRIAAFAVMTVADLQNRDLERLAKRYLLQLEMVASNEKIPGSFWGEPEAGIIGNRIFVRGDTPVHSALHEMSHIVCMDSERRAALQRDAGGDDAEEAAVCYLQIVLADELRGVGRVRLMQDMDSWGYSFRLGSTQRWFADDAADAQQWLETKGLLSSKGRTKFSLRGR